MTKIKTYPKEEWEDQKIEYTASLPGYCGICKQQNKYCRCKPVVKDDE